MSTRFTSAHDRSGSFKISCPFACVARAKGEDWLSHPSWAVEVCLHGAVGSATRHVRAWTVDAGPDYERRCDLSPNGAHFLYFAMNGNAGSPRREVRGTGDSACSVFESDCALRQGRLLVRRRVVLLRNRDFWLNDGGHPGHTELKPAVVPSPRDWPVPLFWGRVPDSLLQWLQRDGWFMEKRFRANATILRKSCPGRGCYESWLFPNWRATWARLLLGCALKPALDQQKRCWLFPPEWEWLDDVDGRLVWAVEGQLWRRELGRGKLLHEELLHDFNGMKF